MLFHSPEFIFGFLPLCFLGFVGVHRLWGSQPALLWLVCPLLLYWISRVWLLGHRGELHDDPIVFALKDPASYLVGVLCGVVIYAAI